MGRINIKSHMLKWARETANISIGDVGVAEERLSNYEKGVERPTLTELRKFARQYNRPLSYFFFSEAPIDPPLPEDFRSEKKKTPLGPAAIFMIREVQERQEWAKEYAIEEEWNKLSFIDRFSENDPPEKVAENIIKELDVRPMSSFQEWRKKCYDARIFLLISQSFAQNLPLGNAYKGFALTDEYVPFIFINSGYPENAQLFTLVHELAHLWINKSGMSNYEESVGGHSPLEVFCNKVAASALMPKKDFATEFFHTDKGVDSAAKKFKVSRLAAIYRAHNLKLISKDKFLDFRDQYSKARKKFLEEGKETAKQGGGGNFYLTSRKRWSKLYAEIVWSAYEARALQPTEAISLLGGGSIGGWRELIKNENTSTKRF